MYVPYLFCLLYCLRTSKSLSMREFDKCHMCMFGLIRIILWLMHIFLRLRSVLVFWGFDCRVVCVEPSFGNLDSTKSREVAKEAQ